jgi:hypothetical protein
MDKTNLELFNLAMQIIKEADANAAENPTADFVQVVVVEPHKKPFKKTIKNDLDAMHEIVGGYIEHFFIGETKKGARVGITLNEEGKLLDLPFNRLLVEKDILVGNFFITAHNLQGDMVSLTDDECETYIRKFEPLEIRL